MDVPVCASVPEILVSPSSIAPKLIGRLFETLLIMSTIDMESLTAKSNPFITAIKSDAAAAVDSIFSETFFMTSAELARLSDSSTE